MGHYYFIQSVKIEDKPKKRAKISQKETLIEWKYEIPPMFFPYFQVSLDMKIHFFIVRVKRVLRI